MATVFVGRSQELSGLAELLDRAHAGNGSFALISGEAGIGKTRLAEELTRSAEARGFACAWGRSWEGDGTPAYFPWTQLLRRLKRLPDCAADFDAPELRAVLEPLRDSLPTAEAEQARFSLFERVTTVLQRAAEARPLLLVLDDIQSADAATLSLLRFVARLLSGTRLLLVATTRDIASTTQPEAARLLALAAREARHFPLSRLDVAEVRQWVEGTGAVLQADRVWQVSEGNALFVEELLATAKKYPEAAWRTEHLPGGIREAIQAHLGLVSAAARRLLESASVLGREPTLEQLRALCPDELPALSEALASGVLRDIGDQKLRFSHILLRDELYASIEPARRGALHRHAATAASGNRALSAHHALEGSRAEDAQQTLELVLAAMREASGRLAHEDAARLGERALERLRAALAPERVAELLVEIGEALVLAGDITAGQLAGERAAQLAATLEAPQLLARAALTRAAEISFGGDTVASTWLRSALTRLPAGDSTVRVELMARLAASINNEPGGVLEQRQLLTDAVAMARRSGDEHALLTALHNAAGTFPEQLTPRERFAMYAETVNLAEATGTVGLIAPLLSWHVVSWLELFEPEQALAAVDRVERLLQPYSRPHYRWRVPLMRALQLAIAGRFVEAEEQSRQALSICRAHDLREGLMMCAIYSASLPYLRGDDVGLSAAFADIEDALRGLPLVEIFGSIWEAPLGRSESVRRSFELLNKLDAAQVPGVASLGWPCARAGLVEHAEQFFQLAMQVPATNTLTMAPGGFGIMGPQVFMVGQLAMLTGRRDHAISAFETATRQARDLRSPPLVAQTELAWAQALEHQSPAAAAEHAALALQAAKSVSLDAVAARAQTVLEARPAQIATPAAATHELSLHREGDVWLLEAAGHKLQLQHAKGLVYLETLLLAPHRPIHALELSGTDERGDAGPALDEQARQAYRSRAQQLQQELGEATGFNDPGRIERAQRELQALSDELAGAFGLGGRARTQGSLAERARINVQRRLRDVIRRVAEQDPALGRHLELSVKTGNFCMYSPTWPAS